MSRERHGVDPPSADQSSREVSRLPVHKSCARSPHTQQPDTHPHKRFTYLTHSTSTKDSRTLFKRAAAATPAAHATEALTNYARVSSWKVESSTSSVRAMSASGVAAAITPITTDTSAHWGARHPLYRLDNRAHRAFVLIRTTGGSHAELHRQRSVVDNVKSVDTFARLRLAWCVALCGDTGIAVRSDHAECPEVTHPWFFSLLFYTVWNYLLQAVFWFTATAASAASLLHSAVAPRRLRTAVHLLLSICLPSAILVSVVLWGVLLPNDIRHGHPEREENFFSYNMHAVNTVCLLAEFFFNGDDDARRIGAFWRGLALCNLLLVPERGHRLLALFFPRARHMGRSRVVPRPLCPQCGRVPCGAPLLSPQSSVDAITRGGPREF